MLGVVSVERSAAAGSRIAVAQQEADEPVIVATAPRPAVVADATVDIKGHHADILLRTASAIGAHGES